MLKRLWSEEVGAIVSAEIMLVATILVLGMVVGLASVRDSVVTELADVALAFANVSQSYSYSGVAGHHAFSSAGAFTDTSDFCDTTSADAAGQMSKCVAICTAPPNFESCNIGY